MKRDDMTMSEQARTRFAKEKRGDGDGREYVAGLTFRELRGVGRMHRFCSSRCGGRQVTVPSDQALGTFLKEHWDPDVRDLKEYVPILEVDETEHIAKLLGIRHPTFKDGSPRILITDLLVCREVANGCIWTAVHTVGLQHGGCDSSATDRIEAEYWKRKGIASRTSVSSGLNDIQTRNLWLLFQYNEQIIAHGLDEHERAAQGAVIQRLRAHRNTSVLEACHAAARANNLTRAECVRAAMQLIATRTIECSLESPVLLAQPARAIR